MAVDVSFVEFKNTPKSPSKTKPSVWKGKIKEKIEKKDEKLVRLQGDPDLIPEAYKRSEAIAEIRSELARAKDPLTGLMNKGPFEAEVIHQIGVVDRDPMAIPIEGIQLDIDDFGKINKEIGQSAGDETLRKVGAKLLATVRDTDVTGRIGGEEFAISTSQTHMLEDSPAENDEPLPAERIRAAIESMMLDNGRKITVSVGTTRYQKDEGVESYKKRLEAAQIIAKRNGKNRVVEGLVDGKKRVVFKDWSDGKMYKIERNENEEITDIIEVPHG